MNRMRLVVLLSLLASLLLSAAAPAPIGQAAATEDLVRLSVDNRSNNTVYLWLSGPRPYYLIVQGEEKQTFTVQRGEYTYSVKACGVRGTGDLDMSGHRTLVMPLCGASHKLSAGDPGRVDLSTKVKVVKWTLENKSTTNMLVIMTGAGTYVFSPKEGEKQFWTVAPGEYHVRYFACGRVASKDIIVYPNSKLELACPK